MCAMPQTSQAAARVAERLYQCGLGYNVAGAGSAKRDYLRRQPPPEAVAGRGTAHMRPGAAIRRPSLNG